MTNEDFRAATDRLKRDRGMSLGTQAWCLGISVGHMSALRSSRMPVSRLVGMALRALSAGVILPEEDDAMQVGEDEA